MKLLAAASLLSVPMFAGSVTGEEGSGVPGCATMSLAAYQQMTGSCAVGIFDFSAFRFASSATDGNGGSTSAPDTAADILVTPELNGASMGFMFSQVNGFDFSAGNLGSVHYGIVYNLFIDPGPIWDGADLSLDPGNVTITQLYCLDGSFVQPPQTVGGFFPGVCQSNFQNTPPNTASQTVDNSTPPSRNSSLIFPMPAQIDGAVYTSIDLLAGGSFTSVTGVNHTTDTSATPEPASLATMGLGLAGLAWLRRKTRSV